jgi:hypothetical protein
MEFARVACGGRLDSTGSARSPFSLKFNTAAPAMPEGDAMRRRPLKRSSAGSRVHSPGTRGASATILRVYPICLWSAFVTPYVVYFSHGRYVATRQNHSLQSSGLNSVSSASNCSAVTGRSPLTTERRSVTVSPVRANRVAGGGISNSSDSYVSGGIPLPDNGRRIPSV